MGRFWQRAGRRDRPTGPLQRSRVGRGCNPPSSPYSVRLRLIRTTDEVLPQPCGLMVQGGTQAGDPALARSEGPGAPTRDPRQLPALIAFLCPRTLLTEAAHLHASPAHSPRLGTAPLLREPLLSDSSPGAPRTGLTAASWALSPAPGPCFRQHLSLHCPWSSGPGSAMPPTPGGAPTPGHSAQALGGETGSFRFSGGPIPEGRMHVVPGRSRPRAL